MTKQQARKLKILNLYSGIGGNRKLWTLNGDDHEITAIENNPQIAKIYQDFFPKDKVIITDAHQYLLEHFKEFDFIWSSPPCPSHSRTNYFLKARGIFRFPDMKLYEEIIFLRHFFKGKYVVENVISYYDPLIIPQQISKHYFWANFIITESAMKLTTGMKVGKMCGKNQGKRQDYVLDNLGIDVPKETKNRRLLLRNCVHPKVGLHIFQEAFREYKTLI